MLHNIYKTISITNSLTNLNIPTFHVNLYRSSKQKIKKNFTITTHRTTIYTIQKTK